MRDTLKKICANFWLRPGEFVLVLVGLLTGFFILFHIIPETIAIQDGYAFHENPRNMPIMWTVLIILSLLFLGVEILSSILKTEKIEEESIIKAKRKNLLNLKEYGWIFFLMAGLLAFYYLYPLIGYFFSACITLYIAFFVYGKRKIYIIPLVPAIVYGIFLFFRDVLNVWIH